MENEVIMKAQAQKRKAAEEERRREDARRRAEEEERQRQAGTSIRGARGRGRPSGRGIGGRSASSGYGQVSTSYVRVGVQGTGRGLPQTTGRPALVVVRIC
jgi:hypothetical protein